MESQVGPAQVIMGVEGGSCRPRQSWVVAYCETLVCFVLYITNYKGPQVIA